MISPFDENLKIDEGAIERIINHLIDGDCHPFVLGTTGESSSMASIEKEKLVKRTVRCAQGKSIIYAGISGNCMAESIDEAKKYCDMGIDVLVAHMPSYYPVDQDAIMKYYDTLASALPCPLIVYNIPMTTHLSIDLETVNKLSYHDNIVGFKDSQGGEERSNNAISHWKNREDFSYLLGRAAMSYRGLKAGADGIVPSGGNLTPQLYSTIVKAVCAGDEDLAKLAQKKTDRISSFYQQNRILSKSFPIFKVMLSTYGLCEKYVLPPMYSLDGGDQEKVIRSMTATYGDLNEINRIEKYG